MTDKEFIELTKDMSPEEILNYYRNLYYNDGNTTERGIVANAINDIFAKGSKGGTHNDWRSKRRCC